MSINNNIFHSIVFVYYMYIIITNITQNNISHILASHSKTKSMLIKWKMFIPSVTPTYYITIIITMFLSISIDIYFMSIGQYLNKNTIIFNIKWTWKNIFSKIITHWNDYSLLLTNTYNIIWQTVVQVKNNYCSIFLTGLLKLYDKQCCT